MILKFYDEFGIYTSREEIESFIENMIKNGQDDDKIIFNECVRYFGSDLVDMITNIMYEDED